MPRLLPQLPLTLVALAGCGAPSAVLPEPPSGLAALASLSGSVDAAANRLKDSLATVEVQIRPPEGQAAVQKESFGGLVLTADGMMLIPQPLDAGAVRQIRVHIAGKEYSAKFLREDNRLKIGLLQLDPKAGPYTPAKLQSGRAPERGDWLVALTPAGEQADYQVLADLSLVRARIFESDVDRLLLGGGIAAPGAPVADARHPAGAVLADLEGNPVGMVRAGEADRALCFEDMRWRLDQLVKPNGEVHYGASDAGLQSTWLGFLDEPLNEDYTEACGLPKGALLVREVFRGTAAEQAGLMAGDVVVGLNGKAIPLAGERATAWLYKQLFFAPDREVALQVVRGLERYAVTCNFGKAPSAFADSPKEIKAEDLGVQVKDVTDLVYATSPHLMGRDGVLVTEVVPGSPASISNTFGTSLIDPGDLILELGGWPTPTVEAFSAALEAVRRKGDPIVLIKLRSGPAVSHAAFNLQRRKEAPTAKPDAALAEEPPTEPSEDTPDSLMPPSPGGVPK